MIISLDNNKKYNGMLNDIRKALYAEVPAKDFRKMVKTLDPTFPVVDGDLVSMREITQEQFEKHRDFLVDMSINQGNRLEYFTEVDVSRAKERQYKTRLILRDGKQYVICSNCGCSTERTLTDDRVSELAKIEAGEISETLSPKGDSFICLNCLKKDVADD